MVGFVDFPGGRSVYPVDGKVLTLFPSDRGETKSSLGGLTREASAMLILGVVTVPPGRVSVTGVPLQSQAENKMSNQLFAGSCSSRSAQAPETCGRRHRGAAEEGEPSPLARTS